MLELIEKYYRNELSDAERAEVQERLNTDANFAKKAEEHLHFLNDLSSWSEKQKMKHKFQQIHAELQKEGELKSFKPPVVVQLWKKYASTAAVAASVALLTVFSHIYITSHLNKQEKIQKNNYVYLKRQVDKLKRTQHELQSNLSTINSSTNTPAPAPEIKHRYFSGTAFAISSQGWVATNYHLIENAGKIRLSNQYLDVAAEVIYADQATDLAILKIKDTTFTKWGNLPYTFGTTTAHLGEDIFSLAYPEREPIYGKGEISAINGFGGDTNAYQVSIPVNPGNSGSPVLNEKGQVIGILSGKQSNSEGIAFVVKTKTLEQLIKQQQDTQQTKRITLNHKKKNSLQQKSRVEQLRLLQNYVFNISVEEK